VSLRTKLLAVVVGLNALILLLALLLLVGAGDATPPAALAYLLRPSKDLVGAHMERWDKHVDGVWLVEDDRGEDLRVPGAPGQGLRQVYDARAAWRATAYTEWDPLPAGRERERALEAYTHALAPDGSLAGRGLVVAMLDQDREGQRRWALVAEVRDGARGARRAYLVMLAGLLLVSGVTYVFISRQVMRPLAALTLAASSVASGTKVVRLPEPASDDELGRTTLAFNRMAAEIHEYQARLEERVLASLSQIKKAEQHLAIAERLAATGKLAAGIAHEINNPLAGMKNAARSLARGDLSPEKTSEYLELIQDGLARVEETVKKVLAFTPRRVEPRLVDLGEVARKALALARHRIEKKGITVEGIASHPQVTQVFGDPLELQQVALNLLLNAADAIAEGSGGRIRLEVEGRGDEVALIVDDNGCGMSLEDQARCYDLFFTTKEVGEGTGLGLSVVHSIVTNHGGRIELTSAPGQGTVFCVLLPREAPDGGTGSGSAPAAGSGGGGPSVTGR